MPDTSAQQPVLVIMGVAGCGKSTVAALLAGQLGWDFQEGDDLHSAENVEKMASGQPLTDDDRWPWLDAVASWIREHDLAGIPGIVTCSSLKRAYRDRLGGPHVVFVYLAGGVMGFFRPCLILGIKFSPCRIKCSKHEIIIKLIAESLG